MNGGSEGHDRSFAPPVLALESVSAGSTASAAIAAGHDMAVAADLRLFFYLPYEHSERLEDQDRAVALIAPLGAELLAFAEEHRDIIRRFGRFPHRNELLGRASTPEEIEFLSSGGFAG